MMPSDYSSDKKPTTEPSGQTDSKTNGQRRLYFISKQKQLNFVAVVAYVIFVFIFQLNLILYSLEFSSCKFSFVSLSLNKLEDVDCLLQIFKKEF